MKVGYPSIYLHSFPEPNIQGSVDAYNRFSNLVVIISVSSLNHLDFLTEFYNTFII